MRNYATFTKTENIKSFNDELGYKPYYDMMKGVYIFALLLTFVCQGLSLLSEYGYFSDAFSANLSGYTLIAGTVLFCTILEASKYFVFKALFVMYFNLTKRRLSPALLILALLISAASIYASVVGGGYLGIDNGLITQAEGKHDSEISTIRTEINDIKKRNTWLGNTYITGADKKLLQAKEAELSAAKQIKQGELQQLTTKNAEKETLYRYWFASFEFVFIICTYFTYYFKRRTVVEEFDGVQTIESLNPTPPVQQAVPVQTQSVPKVTQSVPPVAEPPESFYSKLINDAINKPKNGTHYPTNAVRSIYKEKSNAIRSRITQSVPRNNIGFKFITHSVPKDEKPPHALRINGFDIICLQCGKSHVSKAKHGKFCSEACRIDYHKREGGQKA